MMLQRLSHCFHGVMLLMVLLLGGCASSGQGGLTIIPSGHFLLDVTEDLRDQAPSGVAAPRELSKQVLPAYAVQPGDTLLVEPESLDSPLRLPTDQTILPDGTIDLGRFGRLIVAGKTVEQIEAEVQRIIRDAGEKQSAVNVRLINPRSAVYYVLGEVNSPGAFPITGRETVLDGILAGGGLSSRASRCNIILSRPTGPHQCRVVLPICYRHLTQIGDTTTNYQLMPGDRIYVASRTLCEQLTFWKQNKSCDFCCSCQSACPDAQAQSTTVWSHTGYSPSREPVDAPGSPPMDGEMIQAPTEARAVNLQPRRTKAHEWLAAGPA